MPESVGDYNYGMNEDQSSLIAADWSESDVAIGTVQYIQR